jgi:RNA-binding protein
MDPLLPSFRRELRARAHSLHPVVSIGQHGVTPSVIHEIDVALLAHELVKVRVFSDDRTARTAMLEQVCKALEARRRPADRQAPRAVACATAVRRRTGAVKRPRSNGRLRRRHRQRCRVGKGNRYGRNRWRPGHRPTRASGSVEPPPRTPGKPRPASRGSGPRRRRRGSDSRRVGGAGTGACGSASSRVRSTATVERRAVPVAATA